LVISASFRKYAVPLGLIYGFRGFGCAYKPRSRWGVDTSEVSYSVSAVPAVLFEQQVTQHSRIG